jgi:monoterpene epsilon-lactone hydrolase
VSVTVPTDLLERWSLPQLRESAMATPEALAAKRALSVGHRPSYAEGVTVTPETIAGVECMVCEPDSLSSELLVQFFHGGGYRQGNARGAAGLGSRVAAVTGCRVVASAYRLAPEHPYPAGLVDAVSVYEQLVERSAVPPVLAGFSAGGGLAAALTAAADRAGQPMPSGLVLISPWLDLTCTAETFTSRSATDQLFSFASASEAARMYLQGFEPADPVASPHHAEVGSWPTTLVMASTAEVLLDDSVALAGKLAAAGVDATAWFVPDVPHAWPSVQPDAPATHEALALTGRFVRRVAGLVTAS